MTSSDQSPIEEELASGLRALAIAPSAGLLDEVMRQVDAVQPRRWVHPDGGRPAWRWALLTAAGVVAGIGVGLSAGLLITDRPATPSPGLTASAPAATGPSAASSADASASPAASSPVAAHAADATWERLDLPDPAPGVFGGGIPTDIVAFDGGYVVVGWVEGFCATDIGEPPPNCEATLDQMTSQPQLAAGGAWISADGRSWELVTSPSFAGGRINHVATDGRRIIATGEVNDAPSALQGGEWDAALWFSTDGRDWQMAPQVEPVPDLVAWTGSVWVGARSTEDGPQFLSSADGVAWQATTAPGDLGQGRVEDLAVNADGVTLAVGEFTLVGADGLLESGKGLAWRSFDGQEWQAAPDQDALSVARGGAYLFGLSPTADGWLAVGRADDAGRHGGVWRSRDGLAWERVPSQHSPSGDYMTLDAVTWTDPGFVAIGTIAGSGGSTMAGWVSEDGNVWTDVVRQPALEEGIARAVLADGDLVIAVGSRSTALDHWTPVVYLTSR